MFLKQLDSGLFQGIAESSDYTLDAATLHRLADGNLSTALGEWLQNHKEFVAQQDTGKSPAAAEPSDSTLS